MLRLGSIVVTCEQTIAPGRFIDESFPGLMISHEITEFCLFFSEAVKYVAIPKPSAVYVVHIYSP